MMPDFISIKTRRYSEVVKRILGKYNKDVQIVIDGYLYTEREIPHLLENWCTNQNIKRTIDFNLKQGDINLFGFHDTPDDFWAALSERPFIEELSAEKILKYRVMLEADVKRIRPAKRLSLILLKYALVIFFLFILLWSLSKLW